MSDIDELVSRIPVGQLGGMLGPTAFLARSRGGVGGTVGSAGGPRARRRARWTVGRRQALANP